MPWYTFCNPETVNWASEYVHVPNSVKPAPAYETNVRSCISGWIALANNNSVTNIWKAGFSANPYNDHVGLFSEHFYCGVEYGACCYNYEAHSKEPVTLGSNLYIYLSFSGSKFCAVISDETNNETYSMSRTFVNKTLNPKFFLSVIETPEVDGQITSVLVFNEFQVNSLIYFSGGECISGENSHSTGSYSKYTLSQYINSEGQNQPNIEISFSSSYTVDGGYDVTYLNSLRN
ncbi:hypothetical protein ACNF42_05730 [Cuniculiplasma sp. SKW3]|uniref:hypothetical protein n=1 Tax=Cuniculiplasma sp. SKW3 TaxID=3400170 RepID=UPI003FCF0FA1